MQDFWADSGFNHCATQSSGWLIPQDEYWSVILARPELAPSADASPAELALHRRLIAKPHLHLTEADLLSLNDADLAENYRHFLSFRDALTRAGSFEAFYLAQIRGGVSVAPPLFDAVAQAIVRNLLAGETDAFVVRAGELWFRKQRVASEAGRVLTADFATLDFFQESGGFGDIGRLLKQQHTPMKVQMDILNAENEPFYWLRDSLYCFALDLGLTADGVGRGAWALARVIEKWVQHLSGAAVRVTPKARIDDEHWRWHVGLSAPATQLLNAQYEGKNLPAVDIVSLFSLEFLDETDVARSARGYPIHLALAVGEDRVLKMKPQNLLTGLPFANRQ